MNQFEIYQFLFKSTRRSLLEMLINKMFILIFAVAFIAAASEAKKNVCKPICPVLEITFEEEMYQAFRRHILKGGPADGVCLEGSKYIYKGDQFDLPGMNGCACLISVKSDYKDKACTANQPECPDWPHGQAKDSLSSYAKRFVDDPKSNTNFSDGCCQSGKGKFFLIAESVNRADNICGCIRQDFNHTLFKP
jgi:hypothetical protein